MNKNSTSLNDKLDLILINQKKILKNEERILGEEKKIEELEYKELKNEKNQSKTGAEVLEELDKLNKDLKLNLKNPITKITKRDILKGFVGASIGVMSHFAFTKGAELAPTLDIWRIIVLYILAFILIVVMLYYTGFRTIRKKTIFKFLPLRATVLYTVSIFCILIVNFIFGKIYLPVSFEEIFRIVGANIILAVMGAGTADLIGRNE